MERSLAQKIGGSDKNTRQTASFVKHCEYLEHNNHKTFFLAFLFNLPFLRDRRKRTFYLAEWLFCARRSPKHENIMKAVLVSWKAVHAEF